MYRFRQFPRDGAAHHGIEGLPFFIYSARALQPANRAERTIVEVIITPRICVYKPFNQGFSLISEETGQPADVSHQLVETGKGE